ncbi:MAG TPA: hypothetical protein VK513_07930, partial [Terriglobales bacterium]|nr:hypothetical protein [Terriglobales bacterium]
PLRSRRALVVRGVSEAEQAQDFHEQSPSVVPHAAAVQKIAIPHHSSAVAEHDVRRPVIKAFPHAPHPASVSAQVLLP